MDFTTFGIGLWHPFGPHGRESPEHIIERKRREIADNGWTLWSFQYRRPEVMVAWHRELATAAPPLVFCSNSPGAVDPAEAGEPVATTECRSFRFVNEGTWQPWPVCVQVPHPFRGKRRRASAFVVTELIHPVEAFVSPSVEWLSDGLWRQDRVPTRGEYLIRPGGALPMRSVGAVLVLLTPYLAQVSAEEASINQAHPD